MDEQLEELKRRIAEYARPWWKRDNLNERELGLIENCRTYAESNPSGLPGHNLMILVAKLVDKLDNSTQVVVKAGDSKC